MRSTDMDLYDAPVFDMGEKVRVRKLIRNDGTFPGKEVGDTLAKKGSVGYIVGIGSYLQSSYIYSVHFMDTGYVVGCLKKELESLDYIDEEEEVTASTPTPV